MIHLGNIEIYVDFTQFYRKTSKIMKERASSSGLNNISFPTDQTKNTPLHYENFTLYRHKICNRYD